MVTTILDAWVVDGTYATQNANFAVSAGTDRIVVVGISAEKNGGGDTEGPMTVTSVSLGDKNLTELFDITVGSSTAYHNLLWFGYLLESDIASRVGDTLTINYGNAPDNPFDEPSIHYASYQDVDQTTPIASSSSAINASAATLQPGNVTVGEGDKNVVFFVLGQPNTPSPPTGYTEETEVIGPTSGHASSANHRTATTASAENPTMTSSASTRLAVCAAVIKAAAAPALPAGYQMML